ncbi:MAG: anaerobic sulfite reductase subunit AsrB [Bacillota bacterium]|nr:anaerobic sulfite reductase subunit AsrB [Bacillota bacterium]MDP4158949.1 anaerobic sulfite reductase subunit AsrB [Bacillota bacterium]
MVNHYLPVKAKILEKHQQTEQDWTYRLECRTKPKSGQFMEISLPGFGECPISISDFGEGYLEMTLRTVGKVTVGIDKLKPGDYLYLRGPYGIGFPIETFYNKHLIIAAGGTGLAPVKSVINYFYAHQALLKRCNILAGFKTPSNILFKSDLDKWAQAFSVEVTVDKPDEFGNAIANSCSHKTGLITNLISDIQLPSLEEVRVIIVGPPMMMKYTAQEFLLKGMKKENIWVSFERKMSCGIGKCGHCKIDETYVCLEGPVFNFTKAQTLFD